MPNADTKTPQRAKLVRQQRVVRRLRWLAVGQVALFIYALTIIGTIVSLALADRWECWLLMPLPSIAIVLLFHWGRLVAAESPNDRSSATMGGNK